MNLTPLRPGQIRPQGWIAARLRTAWEAGLPEGSPAWVRHALLVGEGRGNLLVRAWAKRTGASPDPARLAEIPDADADTLWADDLETRTLEGSACLDEYACRMVWADPRGLRVALYGPAVVKAEVAGTPVEVVLDTSYPETKTVEVTLYPQDPVEFTLFFRIPGWAAGCLVTGNGASGIDVTDHDGWIELGRRWNRGDSLTLTFDPGPPLETALVPV